MSKKIILKLFDRLLDDEIFLIDFRKKGIEKSYFSALFKEVHKKTYCIFELIINYISNKSRRLVTVQVAQKVRPYK